MKNTLLKLLLLPILAIVMTGCVSTAVTQADMNAKKASKVYGQVVEVDDAASNSHVTRSCKNAPASGEVHEICQHLNDYDAATTVVLRKSDYVRGYATVPKSVKVQKGYILQVSMPQNKGSSIMNFVRVAATTETDSCRWDGEDIAEIYSHDNGSGAAVKGVVSGLLILPAVGYFATNSSRDGGVICEGWSYKSLLSSN